MPHVINGIGTWYTGKVNVLSRQDSCEFCNKEGTLTSYDTTLYFVVFFIPIIPLGKKRIIEECSICRRHRVMPLAEWATAKAKAFEEATALWRQTPTDPAAARKLIGTYMSFHDNAAFMQAVPEILGHLGGDAATLRVIGSTYMLLGNYLEAEQINTVLLSVEDSRQGREMMAETLIRLKRPAEAEEFVQHVIEEELSDRVWLLYLCAQGHQAVGDHERALAMLDQCKAIMPQLEENKDYKKTRKISEKNRGRVKAIKVKGLESGTVTAGAGSRSGARAAMLIGPLILGAILFAYCFAAYRQGEAREVYVVNGLSKPYVANIGGAKVTLPPARQVRLTIPEGEISVKSADPAVEFPESKIRIETPFWTRPFLNNTYVINPDQAAVVMWQKTYYAENVRNAPQGQTRASHGKALHEFKGIDYPFGEFPQTIKMESGSRAVGKERIGLLREGKEPVMPALQGFESLTDTNAAVELAKRHLRLEPEVNEYVWFLMGHLKPEELIETLKPGLEKRPPLMEWHRMYQTSREKATPDYDLEGEYRKLAEAEPNDSRLMYLLGRACKDRAAGVEWFRKSAAAEPPCPGAFNALAWEGLATGDFAPAAEHAKKAHALEPESRNYFQLSHDALVAAGRHEEALALVRERTAAEPMDLTYQTMEIPLLCALGRSGEADQTIQRGARMIEKNYGKQSAEQARLALEYLKAYCLGDLAAAEAAQKKAMEENADAKLQLALLKGDAAAAEAAWRGILEEDPRIPEENAGRWMTIAAAYHAAGNAEGAAKAIAEAVPFLREGDRESKLFAALLAGEAEPDEKEVLGLVMSVEEKRLCLAALGIKHPKYRKAFFALARKLDYELTYPHLTLKAALEKE